MRRTLSLIAALTAAATLSACAFERTSGITGPSGSASSSPATPGVSLLGMWQSQDRLLTLPNANTCGNFQYQIASQTSNSVEGSFTAVCGGGVTVTAAASGQLHGTEVALTLAGNAEIGRAHV